MPPAIKEAEEGAESDVDDKNSLACHFAATAIKKVTCE